MRDIKELLEILKDRFEATIRPTGLCTVVDELRWSSSIISKDEANRLINYIWRHRPLKHLFKRKFEKATTISNTRIDMFLWDVTDEESRIKWLNKHIKRNS
jgi:hypothetical protein